MAREIKFKEDANGDVIYGEHTQGGVTTLHCRAELYEDDALIKKVMIVGIPFKDGEADRDAKAWAEFDKIEVGAAPEVKPARPDTSKWSKTLTK
jgi:hypothetical protein